MQASAGPQRRRLARDGHADARRPRRRRDRSPGAPCPRDGGGDAADVLGGARIEERRRRCRASAGRPPGRAAARASSPSDEAEHPAEHRQHAPAASAAATRPRDELGRPPADEQRDGRVERQQVDAALAGGDGVRREHGDDPQQGEQARIAAVDAAPLAPQRRADARQEQRPRQQAGGQRRRTGSRPSGGGRGVKSRSPTARTKFSLTTMRDEFAPALRRGGGIPGAGDEQRRRADR